MLSSDLDDDATATFTISEGSEIPAGFELETDGSYRFDPTADAYARLEVGATELVIIPITVTDEQGATDTERDSDHRHRYQ